MSADKPRAVRYAGEAEHDATEDFPGLIVWEERMCGDITVGHSRLPIGMVLAIMLQDPPVADVEDCYPDVTKKEQRRLVEFVRCLVGHDGDWGRLLCVLADVNRKTANRRDRNWNAKPWIHRRKDRDRVRAALLTCLAALDALDEVVPS